MSDEVISDWRVATYTGGQGNCVEVGRSATVVAVRDTKDRDERPGAALRSFRVARVHGASQRLAVRRTGPRSEGPHLRSGGLRYSMPIWPADNQARLRRDTANLG